MTPSEIKKLLIDLEITATELGRRASVRGDAGICRNALRKYWRGELRNPDRRQAISSVLEQRARERKIQLPDPLWPPTTTLTGTPS